MLGHLTEPINNKLSTATDHLHLDAETYRAALRRFHEIYAELDALQKADLLAYLLDDVTITGAEMRIALVGEPDAGRLDAFAADPQLGQTLEWLPLLEFLRKFSSKPAPDERLQFRLFQVTFSGSPIGKLLGVGKLEPCTVPGRVARPAECHTS